MSQKSGAMLATAASVFLLLPGCNDGDPENKPYLEFAGGGFIFNYRLATADYGFVAKAVRDLPPDTVIEARFENPDGGDPFVVSQPSRKNRTHYVFRTPPLQGVEANRDYLVELRVLDATGERILASYERSFRSDVGQDMLPTSPPVVGPGHHPNPQREGSDGEAASSAN